MHLLVEDDQEKRGYELAQTYVSQNLFQNIPCLPGKKNFEKYALFGEGPPLSPMVAMDPPAEYMV